MRPDACVVVFCDVDFNYSMVATTVGSRVVPGDCSIIIVPHEREVRCGIPGIRVSDPGWIFRVRNERAAEVRGILVQVFSVSCAFLVAPSRLRRIEVAAHYECVSTRCSANPK